MNADNWAMLYRCRWSNADAERVVPQLAELLNSDNIQIANEALRALFRIGTPAVSAAPEVVKLTQSRNPITKQLSVLTLGQIAHQVPSLCVGPLALALTDPICCRDALRALAFIGSEACEVLEHVKHLFNDPNAKIRKAALVTAAAIGGKDPEIVGFLRGATGDRSKIVREAASKCLQEVGNG